MEYAQVNGIKIAYERRGKGEPLVLVHGYPLDHSIWHSVAGLLDQSFDLILPDVRGFGESDSAEWGCSIPDIASDIAGLLDHLKIKQAFIAGHSMGGYASLAFARSYPDRVRGLGLIASQAIADTPAVRGNRYATIEKVSSDGIGVVVDSMPAKLSPDLSVQKFCAELIAKQRADTVINTLRALAERDDSTPALSTFHFPMILIHGDQDILIPIDRAREVKSAIPHVQLIELAGAGHMPMLESPHETVAGLKKFLE